MTAVRPVVCAVDVGTSAIRAALVGMDGSIASSALAERPTGTEARFDPERLWRDFCDVVRRASRNADGVVVQGLGITGHVGTILADSDFTPVGQGYGWAASIGTELLAPLWPNSSRATVTGRPHVTPSALAIFTWLRAYHEEELNEVQLILTPKDFLVGRLTGHSTTDHTSAAYTLLLDVRDRAWSQELYGSAGIESSWLPALHTAIDVVGTVKAQAARATGLPFGLDVVTCGPDGTVGSAAAPDVDAGSIVDIGGTTDTLIQVLDGVPTEAHADAILNPYLTQGQWSHGGPTGMTGGMVAFLAGILGFSDSKNILSDVESDLDDVAPGSEGLWVFPSLSGARFPRWRPDERGGITGLSTAHRQRHILRAAQEAAAYVVREGVDVLATDEGRSTRERTPLLLAGGAARSSSVAQLRADVLNRPVLVCQQPEMSLLGAAMLTAVGVGMYGSLGEASEHMSPTLTRYEPRPETATTYERLFSEWIRRRDLSAATDASCLECDASTK